MCDERCESGGITGRVWMVMVGSYQKLLYQQDRSSSCMIQTITPTNCCVIVSQSYVHDTTSDDATPTAAMVQGKTQYPKKVVIFWMRVDITNDYLTILVHQWSVVNPEDTIHKAGMIFIQGPIHESNNEHGNNETKVTVTQNGMSQSHHCMFRILHSIQIHR